MRAERHALSTFVIPLHYSGISWQACVLSSAANDITFFRVCRTLRTQTCRQQWTMPSFTCKREACWRILSLCISRPLPRASPALSSTKPIKCRHVPLPPAGKAPNLWALFNAHEFQGFYTLENPSALGIFLLHPTAVGNASNSVSVALLSMGSQHMYTGFVQRGKTAKLALIDVMLLPQVTYHRA
jgi:hypothetical protein